MGNTDQWMSVIRTVLKVVGAIAIAKGVGDSAGWASITNDFVTLAGAAMAIAGVVGSWRVHSSAAK